MGFGSKFLSVTLAGVLLGMASVAGAHQDRNPLVQPRFYDTVERASGLLNQGKYGEATANANLILMRDRIKISVDVSGAQSGRQLEALEAVSSAIKMWEDSLDGEVSFVVVPQGQGDIRVAYADGVTMQGDEVAGYSVWSRQVLNWANGLCTTYLTADVSLRTQLPDGSALTREAMKHTAGHELGHILGLWDSPHPGDLMGPLDPKHPAAGPSGHELSALRDIRRDAAEVIQIALLAKSRR